MREGLVEKVQSLWYGGLVTQEQFFLPSFYHLVIFLTSHNFITCQDQAARDMKRLEDKDKEKKNAK